METVVLRLSYAPHAEHAPAFVARSRGGFEAEELSVAIEPGLGSGHTIRALSAGEAHFGTVDAFAAMSGWLNGAPITSLLAELQSSLLGVAARVDAGICVPGDLRGHSLGIVPQSATAVAARAVMGQLGLRDGDVRIAGLDPGDDEALLRGSVDAAVAALTNEYVAWRVRHPHIPLVAWPLGEFGIHVYGHVIITNHDVLTARRDLVARFVRAMRSGWDYALVHPADAAAVLAGEGSRTGSGAGAGKISARRGACPDGARRAVRTSIVRPMARARSTPARARWLSRSHRDRDILH
jgi:ABC-type nitrate/sulfonate/bicarbonate transport system substrate-binding protein